MVSIGSADIGAGSQVKIITTNYLVCSTGNVTASTDKDFNGAKNLLTLVQNHFDGSPFRPDYILMGGTLGDNANAAFTTSGTASSTVLNEGVGLSTVNVTAGGSSYTSAPTVAITGGGGSGAEATATISAGAVNAVTITTAGSGYTSQPTFTFTGGGGSGATARVSASFQSLSDAPVSGDAQGTNQASEIIGVLSAGAVELTTNAFSGSTTLEFTIAKVALASGAGTIENELNSQLMIDSATAFQHGIDLSEAIRDVEEAIGNDIDLTQANLDSSFVAPGNADGSTATGLDDVLTASENQLAILSVTYLAK